MAEELVRSAAAAGADAVKFQTIVPERLVTPLQADRISQLERFRLGYDEFERLSRVAGEEGVLFLSTPFDVESARFLDPLVPAFKVASGDNNFLPLLKAVALTGKPILLSTGMSDWEDLGRSCSLIRDIWSNAGVEPGLVLLHCVSSYPTPFGEANLAAIRTLAGLADRVGYSDHTLGTTAAVLAVAVGARVVEKHFTLDRNQSEFRDHRLSADPAEMAELVVRIREAEQLLGDGRIAVSEAERSNIHAARRSIVARRDLTPGEVLARNDLDWLRPGGGLPPGREEELIGRRLLRPLGRGAPIVAEDLMAEGDR